MIFSTIEKNRRSWIMKFFVSLVIFLAAGAASGVFAKERHPVAPGSLFANPANAFASSMLFPPPPPACGFAKPDYDGDCKTDFSIWRPSNGTFYINGSQNGSYITYQMGIAGDKPLQGDYDNDAKTDFVIYRTLPNNQIWWYIYFVGTNTVSIEHFGTAPNDFPVAADYSGDGKTDIAIFRIYDDGPAMKIPAFVYASAPSFDPPYTEHTLPNEVDTNIIPVVSDYNGDGIADPAIWRKDTAEWKIKKSGGGDTTTEAWGTPGDTPVPANYSGGDQKADLAVWKESNGTWYIKNSNGGTQTIQFGAVGDLVVPGDYDGDGITDVAIRRNTDFWVQRSTAGLQIFSWGLTADIPIAKPEYPNYYGQNPPQNDCPTQLCKRKCPFSCT